jgi:Na+-transporting methylmalonyl-CoA/oxaloacetate decarboxylase gamma subunit
MAKGQQKTNKESKKPKKAAAAAAPALNSAQEPVRAVVTTSVMPKGKARNKPAF